MLAVELTPKRKLELVSGRSNRPLAEEIAAHLGVELGEANLREFANGEIHCRYDTSIRGTRRLHHPDPLPAGERLAHGAADHDRRRQAGLGQDGSPRSAPTTATPARTGSRPAASRSRPSWSPTCCRRPGPTGSSSVDLHSGRSRASSTCPFDHLTADPGLERLPARPRSHGDLVIVAPGRRAGEGRRALRPAARTPTWPLVHKRRPHGTVQPGRGAATWSARSRVATACSSTT